VFVEQMDMLDDMADMPKPEQNASTEREEASTGAGHIDADYMDYDGLGQMDYWP
jgi:hypothetical protein